MVRLSRREALVDALVGTALAASGVPGYLGHPWIAAGQAAMGAAVAVRRLVPFSGLVLLCVAFAVQLAATPPGPPDDQVALVAVPVLAYAVAAYRSRPVAVVGFVLLATVVGAEVWIDRDGDWYFSVGIVLAGWLPGFFMYGKRVEVHRVTDMAERLAVEAVSRERVRLARELHDIVSHSVGAMTIQATAADEVFDTAPATARGAIRQVQHTGAQAMTELHRLLGLLRDDSVPQAPTVVRPGLPAIADLVAGARAEGTNDVEYRVEGRPVPVGPALELSVYRIVQESLTNARRHAPGARVCVRLRWPPAVPQGRMTVEVTDTGSPRAPSAVAASRGPGYGLVGIRERVTLFGGELDEGPCGDGYRLRATLCTGDDGVAP